MQKYVEIRLLAKPGCHLCDEARTVIAGVQGELAGQVQTVLTEVNILEDQHLARLHAEDIPVVFVGGKQHAIWRVDPERLILAIKKAARPKLFGRTRMKETP
ncbi:MAG: glutaredoxin family protein [Leucobacter sp.]|nr:glutaredoxin family protein [Leucobacter sp.]